MELTEFEKEQIEASMPGPGDLPNRILCECRYADDPGGDWYCQYETEQEIAGLDPFVQNLLKNPDFHSLEIVADLAHLIYKVEY